MSSNEGFTYLRKDRIELAVDDPNWKNNGRN